MRVQIGVLYIKILLHYLTFFSFYVTISEKFCRAGEAMVYLKVLEAVTALNITAQKARVTHLTEGHTG